MYEPADRVRRPLADPDQAAAADRLDCTLVADCVEQVMRCSDDESLAQQVKRAATRKDLLVAIGGAVGNLAGTFYVGSPLLAAAGHGTVDPTWRDRCQVAPKSLYAELEFLRSLCPPLDGVDLLDVLAAARAWVED